MFSLSYLPTAERLTVVIVKARNINWSKPGDRGGGIYRPIYMNNHNTMFMHIH